MYKQLDETALSSLLAPTLGNIFVGPREAVSLEKASIPLFYWRYVDDYFAVFKTEDKSAQFHCHFNQMHPYLYSLHPIPCLDVMVMRKKFKKKILTMVVRKPTFSGQYGNGNHFVTISAKCTWLNFDIEDLADLQPIVLVFWTRLHSVHPKELKKGEKRYLDQISTQLT